MVRILVPPTIQVSAGSRLGVWYPCARRTAAGKISTRSAACGQLFKGPFGFARPDFRVPSSDFGTHWGHLPRRRHDSEFGTPPSSLARPTRTSGTPWVPRTSDRGARTLVPPCYPPTARSHPTPTRKHCRNMTFSSRATGMPIASTRFGLWYPCRGATPPTSDTEQPFARRGPPSCVGLGLWYPLDRAALKAHRQGRRRMIAADLSQPWLTQPIPVSENNPRFIR